MEIHAVHGFRLNTVVMTSIQMRFEVVSNRKEKRKRERETKNSNGNRLADSLYVRRLRRIQNCIQILVADRPQFVHSKVFAVRIYQQDEYNVLFIVNHGRDSLVASCISAISVRPAVLTKSVHSFLLFLPESEYAWINTAKGLRLSKVSSNYYLRLWLKATDVSMPTTIHRHIHHSQWEPFRFDLDISLGCSALSHRIVFDPSPILHLVHIRITYLNRLRNWPIKQLPYFIEMKTRLAFSIDDLWEIHFDKFITLFDWIAVDVVGPAGGHSTEEIYRFAQDRRVEVDHFERMFI